MRNLNWPRIGLHAIFWLTYLPVNATLNCVINRLPVQENFGNALIGETFSLPVKIALTYFVFYYIIPLYFDRKQVWRMVGWLVVGFVVALVGYRLVLWFLIFPLIGIHPNAPIFTWESIYVSLFDLFITVSAASIIKLIKLHYASRDLEQTLVREKLQSELSFLRAQTNPHFLFNTLNNLYGLARKKSPQTAEGIMMLSKIMRFMLYDCRAPRIPLADEAKVIRDYLELEKLRYTDRLKIHYSEQLDQPSAHVAPLLLLPFVENSFKHGANQTTGDAEISVRLQLVENQLSFAVENTVEDADDKPLKDGIGLQNVKRQLELIYPGRHTLDIAPGQDSFKISLKINLEN